MSPNVRAVAFQQSASLEDIDISQELSTRPIGRLNRRGEIDAMYALAGALRQGATPALKQLSNLAIELCEAGSGGVSVLDSADSEVFRWQALAGKIEHYEGGTTPRNWSPCGECLKAGRAVLYSYPARHFTYFQKLELPIVEGLVIPVSREGVQVGTIWVVSHNPARRFDAEHVRIMTGLASFAVSALAMGPSTGSKQVDAADRGGDGPKPYTALRLAGRSRVERDMVWAEYVGRIARGDELALEALLQETRSLVFVAALRIISFADDAEEITADVYARVWMAAWTFDANRGQVGAWLVSMARSRALDRIRMRAVRSRSDAGLLFRFRSSEDPEAIVDSSETRKRLLRALQAIPFEQRRAIEMFYFSQLSATEIAKSLDHPVGTVKTRLRQGLMKLRRLLAAETPCSMKATSRVSIGCGPVHAATSKN